MEIKQPVQVNISSLTIVKMLLVVAGLAFLWAIRYILAIIFVAWVLASALGPLISRLQRYRVPRSLSIITIYLLVLSSIGAMVATLVPLLGHELATLGNELPNIILPLHDALAGIRQTGEQLGLLNSLQATIDGAVSSITGFTNNFYSTVSSFFGGVITLIGVLVIAFYMTVEEDGLKNFIQSIAPAEAQPYLMRKLNQIETKLSSWLWGQVLAMIFIGSITAFALWLLGVKYWLIIGIFAGLMEIIPLIGPSIAAVPAVFFSLSDFADAPLKPIFVVILYIVIQQLENQIIVPRIMKKAVGLNPIMVIISLLIGGTLGGIVGIVLAIPVMTIINIFISDFFEERRKEQNRLEE